MQLKIFIILLVLKSLDSKLEPLPESEKILRTSISSCVITASNEFKNDNNIITFSLSTKNFTNYTNSVIVMDQILLRAFHDHPRWTLLVKKSDKPEKSSKFFKKSDEYLIQIRDTDEFQSILNSLMQMKSWNPHGRFIIITTTIFPDHKEVVKYIFEILWKYKVLHAVIMLPKKATSSVLDIYSWFPFRDGHCGENFDKAFIINTCVRGEFLSKTPIFPKKIPKNMNNCPINVRAVIWPPYVFEPKNNNGISRNKVNLTKGIEIKLLNTIAEVAKFKIVYSLSEAEQDWGIISRNGSLTGMMKAVQIGEANIGIGAIAALNHRHKYFDPSTSYIWESVTWCIPHAMPISKWKSLINIFDGSIWITIILSYILTTTTIWKLGTKEKSESTAYHKIQNCFQNILSMLLGITVKILPRTTRIRFLTIVWVITSLNLNAAFTSTLIRELTEPSFERQIKSIEEMVEKKFSFGLVPPTPFFFNIKNKYNSNIPNWKSCDNVKQCLDQSAYQRNFAVGIPRMYMQYVSHKYITTKGHLLLYWTKDDILGYPVEMLMTKGFPLVKRINVLISRIKAAGLIAKWQYDFLEKVDNSTMPVEFNNDRDEVILTEKHLEGAFILLSLGLLIATIVFIAELCIYKRKKKYSQKHFK